MVSFLVRNASTLACSRCEASVSFSSSPCSWACCGAQVADLAGQAGLAGQRLAGEVLAPHRQRLLGLLGQLVLLLLELRDLQLDPLAAGRHVGDAAAHLREQLELALVAVVQGLPRVLGAVERLVGLAAEDQAHALHEAHAGRAPSFSLGRLGDVPTLSSRPPYGQNGRTGEKVPHPRPAGTLGVAPQCRPAADLQRARARCSDVPRPTRPPPRPRPHRSRRAARAGPPRAARRPRRPPAPGPRHRATRRRPRRSCASSGPPRTPRCVRG